MITLSRFFTFTFALLLVAFQLLVGGQKTSTGGNWGTAGTWSPSGVPTSGDTVTITSGTVNIDVNTASIPALRINSGATLKFTGAVTLTVSGDMVVNGTFQSATTGSNTGTFFLGGNLTNNGTIDSRDGTNTSRVISITFNNTTSDQTISGSPTATEFYTITLNKGASTRKVICSINVTINNSAAEAITYTNGTWEQSAGTITFATGNQSITSNGGFILSGSGSAVFPSSITGAGGTGGIAGTLTVNTSGTLTVGTGNNRLEIGTGSTATFTAGTVTVGGRFTLSGGSTTINGATINIDPQQANTLGSTNHSFEVSGSANLTFSSGTLTLVDPLSATGTGRDINITSSGTVSFSGGTINIGDGSSASTGADGFEINNSTSNALNNLTIQTGGAALRNPKLVSNLTVGGTLTLTSGTLAVQTNTLTLNGTVSASSGTLSSSTTGTVVYNQSSNGQSVLAINYGNLTFSNFNKILPSSGTIGIAGTFTPGSATGHTITGSTIDFNGTGAQTVPAFNYNNLTLSGARTTNSITLVNGGTIGIAGTFTASATFTSGGYVVTGNTIDYNGSGPQTIIAFNYNNLTSSNSGSRTLASSGTIKIAGTFTPGTNSYTITGSTVEYNGSGSSQSLPSGFTTYNNLNLNNSAGTTGFSGLTVNGTVTVMAGTFTSNSSSYNVVQINNAATMEAASGSTLSVSGNWTNNGTFTPNDGTVDFTKASGTQTVNNGSSSFYNLTHSGGGTLQLLTNNLTVSNNLTNSAGTLDANGLNITVGGNWENTATFTASTGTVTFNKSSGTQTLNSGGSSFNNLTHSGGGVLQLVTNDVDVNGNLTNSAGTLDANGRNITLAGNWSNSGTFTAGSGTVTLDGTTVQTMSGSTFNNLTINNSAGVTLLTDETVNGTLTLMAGNVSTGSNTLTIGGSGSVSRTSGHIIGNLKRVFSSTGSKTFDVGTANGYSPVTVNATSGTGDFTVKAVQGSHPNAVGSNLLGRYWVLTNNGLSEADLSFNYLESDVNGTEANYILGKYDGNWNPISPTSLDATNNIISKTGVTSFSDWTAGEQSAFVSLTIGDVTLDEGNSGTKVFKFPVNISTTAAVDVVVNYETANNTATTADGDYVSTTGSVTIEAGTTTDTISVLVNGETKYENNETFYVNVTSASNVTIADGQGLGTITNDDSPPTISIADATSQNEGNSGSFYHDFVVTLSEISGLVATVNFDASDNTALLTDGDYADTSGTLTFSPGETSKIVTVRSLGDTKYEANETFFVDLSSPSNATIDDGQGVGTLVNDDTAPAISIDNVTANETNSGETNFTFTVSLSAVSGLNTSVNFSTANGSATVADNDYADTSGTLTISAGNSTGQIIIKVAGDTKFETDENFFVNLDTPVNATIADDQGEGNITNDDSQPTISISNVTDNEGNSGTTEFSFVVSLSNASYQNITMDYFTADGSAATADNDYGAKDTTQLEIPANSTSGNIVIDVNGDVKFETNENFFVNLINPVNATFSDSVGEGTITNDDGQPTISINDISVDEGDAGTTNAIFTVSLSNPSYQAINVDFATADSTATLADNDYVSSSGTLTIPAGSTSVVDTVVVNGDTQNEADEKVKVELTNPVNATIADALGIITITNDDSQPSISINDVAVSEGDAGTTEASFTVSLSNLSADVITVQFVTANGTALLSDNDYQDTSGTLTFSPGQDTKSVVVFINGDEVNEANETFFVNLSNPTNAVFGDSSGTGTINNDDPLPTVSIEDADVVDEGNSGSFYHNFEVTLSEISGQVVTVNYDAADNTALLTDNDYVDTSGVITFNPGETSKTVAVRSLGDTKYEANETFFVNLSSPSNVIIGDGQAVGTLNNDDTAPTLSIGDVTMDEGNSGTKNFRFPVTLSAVSGLTTSVDYATANGTATTADADFTGIPTTTLNIPAGNLSDTIIVVVTGDTKYELTENFFVNLTNIVNATFADDQGEGTITNDDGQPTISINDVSVSEGNAGTTDAIFTITLSNPSYQTITVQAASADSSATTADNDYVAKSGTLTILSGSTSVTDTIKVNGDVKNELDEVFHVNLSAPTNATITDGVGRGTIINDDAPPTISINDVSVTELNSGTTTATFTVTLSTQSSQTITVQYSTSDSTALTSDNDYVANSNTLTFTAGETTKPVSITINGDTKYEADEVYHVNLSNPTNATIGDGVGRGVITNDDTPPSLSISDVSLAEGNGAIAQKTSGKSGANLASFVFTVSLSQVSGATTTVQYTTADGSATKGDSDYDSTGGTLEIPAGETSGIITVQVNGDTKFEPDENFFVNLSNALNATIADNQGEGTIENDDALPTLSIGDVSQNEGNSGTSSFNFTVSLSNATYTSTTVDYSTADSTATSGSDYVSNSGTLEIPAGETSGVITVLVNGNTTIEPDEVFFVNLTNASLVMSDSVGRGVILNDDNAKITATAGPNGTISPSGVISVAPGGTQQFVFTPANKYEVDSVFVDGAFVDSTESYTFENVLSDHTIHVTFAPQSAYAAMYRTATMTDWATAVDAKGKAKAIKCKADKVEFKFQIQAPKAASGVTVKIGQISSGTITNTAKTITLGSWTDAKEVTYNGSIDSLEVLQFEGWGTKGKPIKASFVWATSPKVTKGKVTTYILNNPRLPMPNLHNVGNEIGMPITIGNASGASSVKHAKYKDVQKSLNSKGTMHTGTPTCLDVTIKGKPISKQLKSLDPVKTQNNKLFAEVLTLGLNLAASIAEKFPAGLGDLKWDNPGIFKDSSIYAIYAAGNSYLGCDTSGLNSLPAIADSLYNIISTINAAFAGPIDTVAWKCSVLELTGVKNLLEVTIFKPGSSEPPLRTGPKPVVLKSEPTTYTLEQNYPNPFNPTTTISYDLADDALVTMKIYNILGQEIATLIDNELIDAGENEIDFDATGLPSGVYFYQLKVQPVDENGATGTVLTQVKKMMLLK